MTSPIRATATRSTAIVTVLAWLAAMLDGFDLVVLGATLPSMLEDPHWELTAVHGTQISTAGLIGMMIGAMVIGVLTDRFGRKKILAVSVFLFSVLTLPLAFDLEVFWFILFRFLAGLGLGGALPTAISMVTEFRSRDKAGSSSTLLMTGYHVGAVLTALLAIWVIDAFGWQAMFLIGAIPGVILAPLMLAFMPESPQYLRVSGQGERAREIAEQYGLELDDALDRQANQEVEDKSSLAALFTSNYRRNTLVIWATSFMGLLLVYGMNTWLPQIMRQADYDLGNSLGFLLVLNVGAVVGLLIAGTLADRWTPRSVALFWFVASAVFLALLAVRLPLVGIYVIVFVTGVFVFSSQVLVYAFVGANHPSSMRATAMGFSAGVGRIGAISGPLLGGILVSANLAYPWGFFAFAGVGLLGALIFSISRNQQPRGAIVTSEPRAKGIDHEANPHVQ